MLPHALAVFLLFCVGDGGHTHTHTHTHTHMMALVISFFCFSVIIIPYIFSADYLMSWACWIRLNSFTQQPWIYESIRLGYWIVTELHYRKQGIREGPERIAEGAE